MAQIEFSVSTAGKKHVRKRQEVLFLGFGRHTLDLERGQCHHLIRESYPSTYPPIIRPVIGWLREKSNGLIKRSG